MDPNPNQQTPPPQLTVEQTPVPPKPSVNSKTLPIAVVVFIVIMIGLITYVLAVRTKPTSQLSTISPTLSQSSPTPDPTANWKTYTNQKLGIELKHPEDYQVLEESESKITIAKDRLGSGGFWILNNKDKSFGNYKELKPCKEVYGELKINPNERPTCLDVGKSFGQEEDIANLRLGGVDAVSYYSTSTGQGGTFRIIQTVKEPLIEIYFFSDTTQQKTLQDQILSTFQFSP